MSAHRDPQPVGKEEIMPVEGAAGVTELLRAGGRAEVIQLSCGAPRPHRAGVRIAPRPRR